MLIEELRKEIDEGKTAKLYVPKTHDYGYDLTIRIVKKGDGYVWQRAKIQQFVDGVDLPAHAISCPTWDALMAGVTSMEQRDTTWLACDEPLEDMEEDNK